MIATLTKDRPHVTLNVFITLLDELTLIVKGNGHIHLVGFYEESDEDMDLKELRRIG